MLTLDELPSISYAEHVKRTSQPPEYKLITYNQWCQVKDLQPGMIILNDCIVQRKTSKCSAKSVTQENEIHIDTHLATSKGTAHFVADLSESEVKVLVEMALVMLVERDMVPFRVMEEETDDASYLPPIRESQ